MLEKKIKKIVSYMFEKKTDCWIKNASDSTGVFSWLSGYSLLVWELIVELISTGHNKRCFWLIVGLFGPSLVVDC